MALERPSRTGGVTDPSEDDPDTEWEGHLSLLMPTAQAVTLLTTEEARLVGELRAMGVDAL